MKVRLTKEIITKADQFQKSKRSSEARFSQGLVYAGCLMALVVVLVRGIAKGEADTGNIIISVLFMLMMSIFLAEVVLGDAL